MLTVLVMVVCMMPAMAFAEGSTVKINSASDLPATLEAGITYELTQDITLSGGQQIETLAGVLDGKGHTITLADKPLANNVSGTIQNLGVKSSGIISVSGFSGSMAVTLSGIIQNCYSVADLTTSGWDEVGGLVGTLSSGVIRNSYYAGNNSASFAYGLAAYATGGTISNSCYTKGWDSIGMGKSKVTMENVVKTSDMYSVLTTDIPVTGYVWEAVSGGTPVLKEGIAENVVDKSALDLKISEVENYDENKYTAESWDNLQAELIKAKTVLNDETATQAQVNGALADLTAAANVLEKKKPTEPVAAPEDESKIVHITSQSQLEYGITASDSDKYYILDNDIVLDNWYWSFDTFEGVLDGKGHTITFDGSRTGIFANIGKNGVIQNVHFKGSLGADGGACGTEIKGAVINCYTEVSGGNASGFAKRINGGVISNSYSVSPGADGALLESNKDAGGNAYTGTLRNVYWQNDLQQPVDLTELTVQGNTGALSEETMKSMDFVAALNENKGENGTVWGQNSNGYPYFGENKEYIPEGEKPLPDNKVEMAFTPNGSEEASAIADQELIVDTNLADGFGVVGRLSLVDYKVPEGARIEWSSSAEYTIDADTGELYVPEDGGIYTVTATLVKSDSTTEVLSTARVTAKAGKIEAIKLYIADSNGENAVEAVDGKVSIKGSADHRIIVKAKYEGESIYQTVSLRDYSFIMDDPDDAVHHTDDTSIFYFEKPGTATMTVTSKADAAITADVEITSEYVAINSVKPGIEGEIVIHGRNANSTDKAFLPVYAGVIVDPENASYAGDFTITSSDETVGEYVPSMVVGYVPYKAGTVTYTATVIDNGNEISGTSEVKYVYKNPLKKVTAAKSEFVIKEGEKVPAELTFTGVSDEYTVTETGMVWSFDNEGIIKIVRGDGNFVMEGGEKLYFLGSEYTIHGLKAGTVTVTGTPVDNTQGAEPVTFTVTVEEGNLQPADIDKIISTGIGVSAKALSGQIESGLEFGFEWNIIALMRAGKTIDEDLLDQYYDSVAENVKEWTGAEKPTTIERTVLALAVMGKDVTDVEGVDLAAMIYNHDDSQHYKMTDGSNEMAYALLALDAADAEVPDDAKWTREKLIEEILKYQNKEEGFFGLSDNNSGSIDMTCICLQALAPYAEDPDVAAAIDKGLEYLETKIDGNYGYGDANATAQVLLTAAVLNIDVTDSDNGFGTLYSNLITNLDEYRTVDGFEYMKGNGTDLMATYQVMQAFDAYRKAQNEGISYWDFDTAGAGYDDETGKDDNDKPGNNEKELKADVYVTISSEGELVIAQEEITVTDVDGNGVLTIDDALYIAHDEYYDGGAAAGYGSASGASLTKLWGVENGGSYGFYVNNVSAWSLSDIIKEGDYINAFSYADLKAWSDSYCWFDKNTVTAKPGEEIVLTLYGAGYDAEWNPVTAPVAKAVITIDGNASEYVTDEKGKVTIKFDKEGSFVISAVSDNQVLVPPVCKVTVADKDAAGGNDSPAGTDDKNQNSGNSIQTGDEFNMIIFVSIALSALAVVIAAGRRRKNN